MERLLKMHESEWDIKIQDSPIESKNITTPCFSPMPELNLLFCFEVQMQYGELEKKHDFLNLKLKLVKLPNTGIAPTLEMNIDVKITYSDGYDHVPSSRIEVNEMVDLPIKGWTIVDPKKNFKRMIRGGLLEVKCRMVFYNREIPTTISEGVNENDTSKQILRTNPCKLPNFIENIKSLYEKSILCDFVFKVKEKSFSVHKAILAAHSAVFMKMMTDDFQESKTNTVTITDASPETFDLFLKYIYSGKIEDTSWPSVKELYFLADKYDVGTLKNVCTKLAISLLSIDCVCEILQTAYNHQDLNLKSAAKSFAANHISELKCREDWNELVSIYPNIGYEIAAIFFPK